jgi:hypothetical protein
LPGTVVRIAASNCLSNTVEVCCPGESCVTCHRPRSARRRALKAEYTHQLSDVGQPVTAISFHECFLQRVVNPRLGHAAYEVRCLWARQRLLDGLLRRCVHRSAPRPYNVPSSRSRSSTNSRGAAASLA